MAPRTTFKILLLLVILALVVILGGYHLVTIAPTPGLKVVALCGMVIIFGLLWYGMIKAISRTTLGPDDLR